MSRTNIKTLLFSGLILLVLGLAIAQGDKLDAANLGGEVANTGAYVANKITESAISNAVEETRKILADDDDDTEDAEEIDEISQYAETLKFNIFVNDVKAAKGSFNLKNILLAKDKLYKVGEDLTEYQIIYSGLIVKLDKKTEVLSQILESFGDVEYIPYRYMSTPICNNDPFLGVYCTFDFQKGANLQVNFNAKISLAYGSCESGINENTMNFIHAAIRTLIRNHKEVLASKISSTSNEAAQFVFNNKLYDEVIEKKSEAQQLGDITQLFVEKSVFCEECQKAVEKATNNLSMTQANFEKFKPLTEQGARDLANIANMKGLLENEQAVKSSRAKVLEGARSRLAGDIPSLQNYYDTHIAGIYPLADGFSCSARGRTYNIPASLPNANMKQFLSRTVASPECPFTMNLFYGGEVYNPTRMNDVVCTGCENNATGWNDMGDSLVYLDRHNVSCPSGSAIQAFQFENTGNQIRIAYRCLRSSNISGSCSVQQTPWNAEGKEFYYLDRHFLDCGTPGRVVNSFKLIRTSGRIALQYTCCGVSGGVASWYRTRNAETGEGHRGNTIGRLSAVACQDNAVLGWYLIQNNWDKMRFEYGCVTVNDVSRSSVNLTKTTPLNGKGSNSVYFLDRHNVHCFDNSTVLSSFRLENHPNNQMRFHYSCASHPSISNDCSTYYTQWDDVANESFSLNYVDRHFLVCGKRAALKGFQMERSGSRIRFRYGCCKANIESSYIQAETKSDADNFQVDYLDRQFLVARPDEVISSVRLVSNNGPNQLRFFAEYSRLRK